MKNRYTYVAAFSPEPEGGFKRYVPSITRVLTQGATFAEALEMAEEVLALYLESIEGNRRGNPGTCVHGP